MTAATFDDEAAIRRLIDRWAAAVRERDLDGIVRDHSPDILMFDLPGPTQGRGIQAYRDSWPQLFDWFHGARVFDVSDLEIVADRDVAFATGLIRCEGVEANGTKVALAVRLTVGLRKADGRWTVLHEHHSIPSE